VIKEVGSSPRRPAVRHAVGLPWRQSTTGCSKGTSRAVPTLVMVAILPNGWQVGRSAALAPAPCILNWTAGNDEARRVEVSREPDDVERATDRELIEAARAAPGAAGQRFLDALYGRYYSRVAYWCLRISGNRHEAADLAQEVFLRVHSRFSTFRMESEFSTWLYAVVRSVAINRGRSAQRREAGRVDATLVPEPSDPHENPGTAAERGEVLARLRRALASDLKPTEARVLYLHYVDGLTLPVITRLLGLENPSGAKAFVVAGLRKLRRSMSGLADVRVGD